MATNVHLTPELEKFARKCVKSGRYNNVSEVVRSALRLMQEQEKRRRDFAEMLDAARAEAEREGVHDAEAVAAELDKVIRSARR
jgi:antitoxin ParD1/3/4